MASTINAAVGGVITTGDNSGALNIQTSGSNAMTITSGQAVTFPGAVTFSGTVTMNGQSYTWPASYGTSGQFLQTNGAGVLSWGSVTTYGGNAVDFVIQSYGIS